MKKTNLLNILPFLWVLITFTTVSSCKRDDPGPCGSCLHNGICENGTCLCEQGYEGVHCATLTRAKFLGDYYVTSGTINCSVTGNGIISSGTAVTINDNIAGLSKVAIGIGGSLLLIATVNGQTLSIDNQSVGGYTYSGVGTLNGNVITLSFNEYDITVPETCVYSLTASKQ